MPNELKQPLIATTASQTRKIDKPGIRGGYANVMVWTIGGVVLASCTYSNNDTDDLPAFVGDGPIAGANVYVDLNENGVLDEGEPTAITDEDGYAQLPSRYLEGYSIIADVTGAVDLETGTVLTGQFRAMEASSSDASVLATPLTDLLADAEDPQSVLDAIFGEGVVTVADVTDTSNYRLPEGGGDLLAPEEGASAETVSDFVSQQISLASIALTELKENPSYGVNGASAELDAGQLQTVLTSYFESTNNLDSLRDAVGARLDKATNIKNGAPIAVGGEFQIDEDTSFRLDSVLMDSSGEIDVEKIETVFGFADPGGNSGSEEGINGVFVKVKGIANASVGLGRADETPSALTAGTGIDDALEAMISTALGATIGESISLDDFKGSYAFVNLDTISGLVVTPDIDYIGMVELEYRVWDGENFSAPATLTITVTDVDEAPTGIALDRVVLLPAGGRVGAVTVTDPDVADGNGANYTASNITVGGTDAAFFTVTDVSGEAVLSFASGQIPALTSYAITLTASDPDDGTLSHSENFNIVVGSLYFELSDSSRVFSNNAEGLIEENADGSTAAIAVGTLGHEGGNTVFELAAAGSGNNNDQFSITSATSGGVTSYTLNYTDSNSGDFEAGDTLTVSITSTDTNNDNAITEDFIIHLTNVNDNVPEFEVAAGNLVQDSAQNVEPVWSYFVIKDTTETDSVTNVETRTQEYIEYLVSGGVTLASDGMLTIHDGAFQVYRDVSVDDVFQDHDDVFTGRSHEIDPADPLGGEDLGPRDPLSGQVVAYKGLTLLADDYDENDIFYLYQDRDGDWGVARARADVATTDLMGTLDTSDDVTTYTTSADVGDYVLFQINGDKTGFERFNEAATTFEITADNVANFPQFDVSDIGTHPYELDSYAVVDVAEGTIARTDTDTPVYQVQASDADNDAISYELVNTNGGVDHEAFRIDASTGMIYLKPVQSSVDNSFVSVLDHEGQHTHNLVVRAGKEVMRQDPNDPTKTITELENPEHISVMIRITDVDEGPYDIEIKPLPSFARDVNVGSEVVAARLLIHDQDDRTEVIDDPDTSGEKIRAVVDGYDPAMDITLTGADHQHFTVKEDDDGELILVYTGGADNIKNSYDLKVTATDPNAVLSPTKAKDITFSSPGIILVTEDGVTIPSGYISDSLLEENSDGSSSRIELGSIGHEAGHTKFVLARDENGNFVEDNNDFQIGTTTTTRFVGGESVTFTEYTLYYKGADSGDFEAGDTLTVRITASEPIAAVNPDSTSVVTEDFIINLGNDGATSPEISTQSLSVAAGASVSAAIGTVSATDRDGDDITYSLAAGLKDSDKFEINSSTGAVTVKSGEISSFASGDSYEIVVLASNSKDDRPATEEATIDIIDQPYVFLHGLILSRKDGAPAKIPQASIQSLSEDVPLLPEDLNVEFIVRTTQTLDPPVLALIYRTHSDKLAILSKSATDKVGTLEEIYNAINNTSQHYGPLRSHLSNVVEARYATDADGNEILDRQHTITFASQEEAMLFQDYEVITIDVV